MGLYFGDRNFVNNYALSVTVWIELQERKLIVGRSGDLEAGWTEHIQ